MAVAPEAVPNDPPKIEIEFLPWYLPGERVLRCEGAAGCGALVMSDDAERHQRWHQELFDSLYWLMRLGKA